MINKKLIFGLLCLGMLTSAVSAQQLKVMEVSDFEDFIVKESDTLFVYNFWATWCGPCVAELPYFERLNKEYRDQKIKIVLVSLDFPNDWEKRLTGFLTKKNIQSNVIFLINALRPMDWISRMNEEWSGALPATMLRMPSRDINEFREQEFSYEELKTWVSSVLNRI